MTELLEFRAAEVAAVSFPNRTVELIVMPYETETLIGGPGRPFTEIVSRTAFEGIEARNGQVRVNRDHDVRRSVGRAMVFHPSRQEGLVAEVRISKTELGEETLILADDGVLDASAGFAPLRRDGRMVPGAEVWESQQRRRLNHVYLGHIALTPEPAYETARVLAVRSDGPPELPTPGMPNRERLELQDWQRQLDEIDLRYSRV